MSVKKKTQVRTGKMVRELMLADEDVNASLIMVYSENGVNAEIKIEGLTPKCNEELFLSGNVDWNKSVIYKIVDFTGNAEVGKVTLTAMNKNNVSLEVERVMWSKENKEAAEQEETVVEATPKKEVVVEAPKAVTPAPKPITRVETPTAPKPTPVPTPKSVSVEAAIELSTPAPVKKAVPTPVTKQETAPVTPTKPKQPALTETNTKLQENYVKLVKKTIEVCQDYELGIDIDDSIEGLKKELQSQGISVTFDKEIMDVVNRLRSLQDKGIKVEKVLNLL
jgi:outer membrane biosynthesis protein TonB